MSKIREIIEKYAPIDSYLAIHGFYKNDCKIIHYEDFDKLEEDIQEYVENEINAHYTNLGYELKGLKWVKYESKQGL